jgi:hypothetical protein
VIVLTKHVFRKPPRMLDYKDFHVAKKSSTSAGLTKVELRDLDSNPNCLNLDESLLSELVCGSNMAWE